MTTAALHAATTTAAATTHRRSHGYDRDRRGRGTVARVRVRGTVRRVADWPVAPGSARSTSVGNPAHANVLRLQRLACNRAVVSLLEHGPKVQRCGTVDHSVCPCADGEAGGGGPSVQRAGAGAPVDDAPKCPDAVVVHEVSTERTDAG